MLVYRIEHQELGVGPMCGHKVPGLPVWHHMFYDHQPPCLFNRYEKWRKSKSSSNRKNIFFGAKNKDFIRRIIIDFNSLDVINTLTELGFVGVVYEAVDFVVMHDGQIAFDKPSATLVSETDLLTFFLGE